MKKLFFLLLTICILINLFIVYNIFHTTPLVIINNHVFYIEVAKTPKQQEIGLAKYTSFPINKAMYFPFGHEDYYTFWMKGMHFPIDILFVRNKKIVTLFPSVPVPEKTGELLPTYKPTSPVDSVLEINAGLSEKYGFKVGDTIQIFD